MNLTPFFQDDPTAYQGQGQIDGVSAGNGAWIRNARLLGLGMGVALVAMLLGGCSPEPPAAAPTPNPHAHKTATILVSVSDSHIDAVGVASTWQLGNFKCAPVGWPEGNLKDQPVFVNEKVTRLGINFKASILLDRFKHDKCNWFLAVSGIDFMSNGKVYATYAFILSKIVSRQSVQIKCLPSPIGGGICTDRQLNSAEERIEHKLDATVEYLP